MTSVAHEFKQFPPYFGEDRKRCLTEEEMEKVFENCEGLVRVNNGGGYVKISKIIYIEGEYVFQTYELFELADYIDQNKERLAAGQEPLAWSEFLTELKLWTRSTEESWITFEQFLEEIKYDFPNLVLGEADEIPVFEFNEGLEKAIEIKNEVIYFKYWVC